MSAFAAIARRNPAVWRLTTRLKLLIKPHEPEMALLGRLVPRDRVAVDVGANMGNYTAALADLARSVIAFEPNPKMAADIGRLLPGRVRVITAAASNRSGDAELRIPDTGSGRATIESANALPGATCEVVTIQTVRLDDCDLGDVGFLKIDVEGHEMAVLDGAEQTIRACRPAILVEAQEDHRPRAVETVRAFLEPLGYACWVLVGRRLTPLDEKPPGWTPVNLLFLPC